MPDGSSHSRTIVAVSAAFLWCLTAQAADVSPVGAWRVVSYAAKDVRTGELTHPFGEQVMGMAIYSASGQMSILVAGRDRVASTGTGAQRFEERSRLFDTMYAYTGRFSVKGDKVTIHVDAAWQPDWVGTDRVRTLTLDHDTLTITTPPMQSPVDGQTYISITSFRRAD
jgi:Lipocalin-like domain